MGYFYEKMLEASAVADAIQDPDNVGNDLNEIEDAIMGDDGIEAHRDEIEDAVEGMIGDPVEEASVLIFESDYNFNQLMKAIGITELNEACAGREFFLEGENAKSFKEKVIQFFKDAWAKLCQITKNVIDGIKKMMPSKKKFIQDHLVQIRQGYNRSNWSVDMFDMEALSNDSFFQFNPHDSTPDDHKEIIKKVSGIEAFDIKEMADRVTAELFKKTTYSSDNADSKLFNMAITLSRDPIDLNELKKQHKKIKAVYDGYIKMVKAQQLIDGAADNKDVFKNINDIRFESTVVNKLYSIKLKAARKRNDQAWKLITHWASAGKKKVEPSYNVAKPEGEAPKNESGFMNIDII